LYTSVSTPVNIYCNQPKHVATIATIKLLYKELCFFHYEYIYAFVTGDICVAMLSGCETDSMHPLALKLRKLEGIATLSHRYHGGELNNDTVSKSSRPQHYPNSTKLYHFGLYLDI
jgi:hypothetical protein